MTVNEYLAQYGQLGNANVANRTVPKPVEQPKKKGNLLTSLIPTAGSILGGAAGTILAPGVGTAAGGAAGGMVGLKLRNLLTGQKDNTRDYLTEGGLGALGGLGKAFKTLKGASSAVRAGEGIAEAGNILRFGAPVADDVAKAGGRGLFSKLGGKLEEGGNKLLGTQSNLTRAETRSLGRGITPASVLGDINKRTGLNNIEGMANVGANITGKDGVFSELTRNAIGNTRGVDIGDLRKVTDALLVDKAPLITGKARTNILDQVKNSVVKGYGGSKGSLSTLADPYDAFDASKTFREMASNLKKGVNVSAKDKQLASVYDDLGREIEKRLFASEGVGEGLKLAKPQAKEALLSLAKTGGKEGKAYKAMAKELDAITDIPGLRKAQKSFVDLSKIDEATANARAGAGAQLGDQAQGLGKLVQRPTNLLAMPLNAATPGVAGAMTKTGRLLQGVGTGGGSGTIPGLLKAQGARGALTVLGGGGQEQPVDPMATSPDMEMGGLSTAYGSTGMGGTGAGNILGATGAGASQSMYTREAAAQDIQRDLATTGGKNMDLYLKLFEFMNPEPTAASQKPLSESQQGRADVITALGNVEGLMGNGSINYGPIASRIEGVKGMFNQGDPETLSYKSALGQIRGAIAKARAGSSMTPGELKLLDTYTPKDTDSEQVVRTKLAQLRALYGNEQPTGGYDASSILAQQYGY